MEQGKKAMESLVSHLLGKAMDPEIFTPLRVITKANVDQYQPAY